MRDVRYSSTPRVVTEDYTGTILCGNLPAMVVYSAHIGILRQSCICLLHVFSLDAGTDRLSFSNPFSLFLPSRYF